MSKSKKDEDASYTLEEFRKLDTQEFSRQYNEYRKKWENHMSEHMNTLLYGANWKEVLKTKKALEEFDRELEELVNGTGNSSD